MTTLKAIPLTLCAMLSLSGLAYNTEYSTEYEAQSARPAGQLALSEPAHDNHIMVTPDALEWQDGPPSLPSGAQFVVLEGSPAKEGPLTLRLKFPPGFEIPAHYHPALEHVTVLSGTFYMGTGDELDRGNGSGFPAGSFVVIPVGSHHFAWVGDEETIVQLHSTGPFDSSYVEPANDPRNQ